MKKRKLFSIFLALSLIMPSTTTYSDTLFPITYNSENGLYSAEKISHPNDDIKQSDGIIDYDSGENDRGQNYSWSAVAYGDYMYVGTLTGAISKTLRIIASQNNIDFNVFKATIDVLFNGNLYMDDPINNPDNTDRSALLKINTKTGKVEIIAQDKCSYRAAIEYKDKLYFAAAGSQPYLLEVDPATDTTQVVYTSQKPSNPYISVGIRGLTVANNELVASMIGDNGTYVVASNNPSDGQDAFEVIATQEDLLDYPAYHYNDSIFGGAIWDMVEFNNKLYMTVVTGKAGNKEAFAMFCGEKDSSTGKWCFKPLIGNESDGAIYPLGLGADRSGAANLFVYDNHLYIGGYNDPMIALPSALNMDFEELYKDLSSPVCLWRMDSLENIELVAGEPNELFPTVLGNQTAGFGSNMNQYVWRMSEYDNKFYLGTFDISSLAYPLMQFTNGDILRMTPDEIESQINYIKVLIDLLIKEDEISINSNDIKDTSSTNELDITNEIESDYVESISDSDKDLLSDSLEIMVDNLDEIEENLASTAYVTSDTRAISFDLLEVYEKLLSAYEKVKDKLPEELVNNLDKILNQDTLQNLTYFFETCNYLSQGERGFDLFASEDGLNFTTITTNGFGDPFNHGCRIFAPTDTGLCVGTANPFYGTQVWKLIDNSRGEIINSYIHDSSITYDKNNNSSENSTDIKVDFNGNTLKSMELNYEELISGTDYTVLEDKIVLSNDYLNSLEIGSYTLKLKFSAGANGIVTLNIVDSTSDDNNDNDNDNDNGNDNDDNNNNNPNTKPDLDNGSDKPSDNNKDNNSINTDNKKPVNTDTSKEESLPITGAPYSSILPIFLGFLAVISGVFLKRKKLNQ